MSGVTFHFYSFSKIVTDGNKSFENGSDDNQLNKNGLGGNESNEMDENPYWKRHVDRLSGDYSLAFHFTAVVYLVKTIFYVFTNTNFK